MQPIILSDLKQVNTPKILGTVNTGATTSSFQEKTDVSCTKTRYKIIFRGFYDHAFFQYFCRS